MFTTEQIVSKYTASVQPTDRYAVVTFSGGNSELTRFLNAKPPGWSLVTVQLASVIGSPVVLFEITPVEPPQTRNGTRAALAASRSRETSAAG